MVKGNRSGVRGKLLDWIRLNVGRKIKGHRLDSGPVLQFIVEGFPRPYRVPFI